MSNYKLAIDCPHYSVRTCSGWMNIIEQKVDMTADVSHLVAPALPSRAALM